MWGIILGMIVSICLYVFAFYIFETLRSCPQFSRNNLYIFTENEMSLYKWFYAVSSIILGHAITIKFLSSNVKRQINTPKKARIRLINIQNDQTYFSTYFLHWIFGCLCWLGFIINFSPYYWSRMRIDFYEDYTYLFFLLPLVLWLSSWTNLLRLFKRKTYKWMLISFVSIFILSFGLSQVNVVDYKGFNENYLKNRPVLQYTYDLSSSECSQKHEKKSRLIKFYIGYKKSEPNPQPTILFNESPIVLSQVPEVIVSQQSRKREAIIPFITTVLVADKNIPMTFIDSFKNELRSVNALKISYTTQSAYENPRIFTTSNLGLGQVLPPFSDINDLKLSNPPPPPPPFIFLESDPTNKIQIRLNKDNSVLLNGVNIKMNELAPKLKFLISEGNDYAINFTKDSTCTLDQYIQAQTQMRLAIQSLRNKLSQELYNEPYDKLRRYRNKREQVKQIQRAIPSLIWEDL